MCGCGPCSTALVFAASALSLHPTAPRIDYRDCPSIPATRWPGRRRCGPEGVRFGAIVDRDPGTAAGTRAWRWRTSCGWPKAATSLVDAIWVSATAAFHDALRADDRALAPIGIATDGRWVLTSGDPARLALSASSEPSVDSVALPGAEITPRRAASVGCPGEVPRDLGDVDVVLPLLHGTFGEDGTLQGLLEMAGTRYAGRACSPARPAWTRST